jgi:hypothetical protein
VQHVRDIIIMRFVIAPTSSNHTHAEASILRRNKNKYDRKKGLRRELVVKGW